VYYSSPGSATGSNTSVNAEYVVIRNGDDVSHTISGQTVWDAAGHICTFSTLRPGFVHPAPGAPRPPEPVLFLLLSAPLYGRRRLIIGFGVTEVLLSTLVFTCETCGTQPPIS
jgi:hypothetical protein